MNKNFHKEIMTLAGHTYHDGAFTLPPEWQELSSLNAKNGFQATVYKKYNEIVISYRGTNNFKDYNDDLQMWKNKIPDQFTQAEGIYKEFKHLFPDVKITVTGHSLGGSLAQLVSAKYGCQAVTFNAYGTGDILKNAGYYNTKNLNIINYGNPNDPIFTDKYMAQPGRTLLTNTNFKSSVYWDTKHSTTSTEINMKNHFLQNMGPLEDAVEVEPLPPQYEYDVNNIYQASVNKTFTREEIANMSNEDYLKYEPQILQQLKNGQFKEQKPDYDNFVNPNTGSKKIYTKEELAKMSADEFMKNEAEIMGQLQSIGLPSKSDLPGKSFDSDDGRWVTINGNHVFIEK